LRSSAATPPGDAILAGRICEPQKQIAVAGLRSAKADEVIPAQFIERTQQLVLIPQPGLMLGNHVCTIAIGTNPEWITPFAATPDI
jgi:hypothetical protein